MNFTIETLLVSLFSGFAGSLITASITKSINEKNQKLKYVTEERQKWRAEIREETTKLAKNLFYNESNNESELERIKAFFKIRLNPIDDYDKDIIKKLENINRDTINDFVLKISCLLKHDWERAKKEAKESNKIRMTAQEYYKKAKGEEKNDT